MGRSVTVNSGQSNVQLPNGVLAQAGQTVILTDKEFGTIPSSIIGASPKVLTDNGPAGDSVYTPGTAPTLTSAAAAGGTPTKTEFDKVVVDVAALRTALTGTGKALN